MQIKFEEFSNIVQICHAFDQIITQNYDVSTKIHDRKKSKYG